ncbi:MAG: endolytic transglycosylase MltG [Firmicutes bacterium]|nr:endolytic transglycosylase MltG [Bacillota bacterium]
MNGSDNLSSGKMNGGANNIGGVSDEESKTQLRGAVSDSGESDAPPSQPNGKPKVKPKDKPKDSEVMHGSYHEKRAAAVEKSIVEEDGKMRQKSRKSDSAGKTLSGLLRGVIYILFVSITGIAIAVFAVIPIGNDMFAFVKDEEIVDITIPELATINDVAEILYENGLIEYPEIFKIYANFQGDDGEFVAGEYSLSTTLNYGQLLDSFKSTETTEIISITIPEGYTTDEIIALFVENGIGTYDGFVEAINEYDWSLEYSYWFIDELEENGYSDSRHYRLEGYLFPDTYYFYTTASEVSVIAKLLDNFETKFPDTYRARAEVLGMTVDEIVTLASMIQSEAKYLSEYALVSSVFHNRLNNSGSYPYLESVATIIYAIYHDTGERPTTLESVSYNSDYNTYTHTGLPPGAICNPGYNALTYALYPTESDYFYFVTNTDGYSVFSTTYAEHLAAIEAVENGTAISTVIQNAYSEYDDEGDDE